MDKGVEDFILILLPFILLIAFIGLIIYLARNASIARNKVQTTLSGKSYFLNYAPPNHRYPGKSEISIEAETANDFSLIQEGNALLRLAEKMGFTRKLKTDDARFDNKVFIACDDPDFFNKIHTSSALRDAVMSVFMLGIRSIASRGGKLTASLKKTSTAPNEQTAEQVVTALNVLKRQLPPLMLMGGVPVHHPNVWRARLFKWFFIGSLIFTVIEFFIGHPLPHRLVDHARMLWIAVAVMIGVTVLSLLLIKVVFSCSSLGYDVLKKFLAYGLWSIIFWSYVTMCNINEKYDVSVATVHDQKILDKYITYSKNIPYYYVTTEDWHPLSKEYSITVNHDTYLGVTPNHELMRFYTHSGYLKCEWIELNQVIHP